ncbi:MAG: xylulokinase [Fretibacterium sp.]|nr:xylulokinase [Fretibacterium sp.]
MPVLLGIDIGTSSARALLLDAEGQVLSICQEEYAFDIPELGWAEQDPEVWWRAVCLIVRRALCESGLSGEDVHALSFSGQMHGLIPLDREGRVLRKGIIWCDQRSSAQVRALREKISASELGAMTGNTVNTGSLLASLLWMREFEPELFPQIDRVLLPKDYIRFKMTGLASTELTDAAGTLAFDVKNGCWSHRLLDRLGLDLRIFPKVFLPSDVAGALRPEAAEQLGLSPGCLVIHGAADQVMQALGNGMLEPGTASVTIGTGGQVLTLLSAPQYDPGLSAHTFNYLTRDLWYFLGATLSAGLSLRWLRGQLFGSLSYKELDALAHAVPPGSEGLIFLPYLLGERTPHMDPEAKGLYFGLSMKHGRGHLIRSTMEGVAYSLKESFVLLDSLGIPVMEVIASGGGARSPLWLQIQADILNHELRLSTASEQASLGAAINASVGAGLFKSYREACSQLVSISPTRYHPIPDQVARYEEGFETYKALYARNKDLMRSR